MGLLKMTALALLVLGTVGVTTATARPPNVLRVCNYSDQNVEVALGQNKGGFFSTGWYGVPSGSCRGGGKDKYTYWDDTGTDEMGYKKDMWFFATRTDNKSYGGKEGDGEWAEFCILPNNNFKWLKEENCTTSADQNAKNATKRQVFSHIHVGGLIKVVVLNQDGTWNEYTTPDERRTPPPRRTTSGSGNCKLVYSGGASGGGWVTECGP
jgi:hypothetical protein